MPKDIYEQLRRDEGVVLHAYQDSLGYWTLGCGRLIDKRRGGGIKHDEVEYLLVNDVAEVEEQLAIHAWVRQLKETDPVRYWTVVNMAFNLGVPGFLKFSNTIAAIKRGDYDTAADGMLKSKWASQVGARAERLALQMRHGDKLR